MGYGKKTALLEEAITQMNAGKYGRTSAVLKELLALDPHNMEARRLFATLHLRLGSLIPARQAFDSLIGEAFERQDYWLAESLLREYLAAGPRCVPYLEKLGSVYEYRGENIEAVAEYGKAIEILIEDPDPDNPGHAAQLYKTIVDLAPASPAALRLAGCFDLQTGEMIARPPTFQHEEGAAEESPCSVDSEPPAELSVATEASVEDQSLPSEMSWEQVGRGEERFGDTGPTVIETSPVWSMSPSPTGESSVGLQEEQRYDANEELRSGTYNDGGDRNGLESDSALAESEVSGSVLPPEFHVSDRVPQATQEDTVVQAVPPPMPWEDIREEPTDIPDQTGTASSGDTSSASISEQDAGDISQDKLTSGAVSWDSVLDPAWQSERATSSNVSMPAPPPDNVAPVVDPTPQALAPASMREIDPGTVEIPQAIRSQLLPGAAGESVVAPMPWDHVQESTVTIPAAQTAVPAVESLADDAAILPHDAEPVETSYPEPVAEPDRSLPLSVAAQPGAEPEAAAYSSGNSSFAPPVLEQEESQVSVPSEPALSDHRAIEETLEPQPLVPYSSTEVATPIEPVTSLSSPESLGSPALVEEVPADTRYEETPYPLTPESTASLVDSDPAQLVSQVEPAPSLTVSDLSEGQNDRLRAAQIAVGIEPLRPTILFRLVWKRSRRRGQSWLRPSPSWKILVLSGSISMSGKSRS